MSRRSFAVLKRVYETAHGKFQEYCLENRSQSPRPKTIRAEDAECQKLSRAKEIAKDIVLGHPDSFDRVRTWMVDVHGKTAEKLSEAECKEALGDHIERRHKAVDRRGELAKRVCVIMEEFHLTDSGQGGSSWHLGCHCTEAEAQQLIRRLYREFDDEIDSGVLSIERHAWSLGFTEQPQLSGV